MERTLQVLNALQQEGILSQYAIAGAMGATFYAEPLLTFDFDIIEPISLKFSAAINLKQSGTHGPVETRD